MNWFETQQLRLKSLFPGEYVRVDFAALSANNGWNRDVWEEVKSELAFLNGKALVFDLRKGNRQTAIAIAERAVSAGFKVVLVDDKTRKLGGECGLLAGTMTRTPGDRMEELNRRPGLTLIETPYRRFVRFAGYELVMYWSRETGFTSILNRKK